jgi:hypothetical protein
MLGGAHHPMTPYMATGGLTLLRHWLSPLAVRCRDCRRFPGGIGRRAFVQRVERILQDLADAGRAVGIDRDWLRRP